MKKLSLLFVLAMLFGSMSAQGVYSEKRNVSNFDEVTFSVSGNVYISIGNKYDLSIEGDRDYVERIETVVEGSTLRIKSENGSWRPSYNNKQVNVYITMPEVNGIHVAGSGKVHVKDLLQSDDFEAYISGSGNIILQDIKINEASCAISGSGDFITEGNGRIDEMDVRISGSGNYNAPNVTVDEFDVNITGSGKCDCTVTGTIEAGISGSGSVYYAGNPKVNARISGSGKVRSK